MFAELCCEFRIDCRSESKLASLQERGWSKTAFCYILFLGLLVARSSRGFIGRNRFKATGRVAVFLQQSPNRISHVFSPNRTLAFHCLVQRERYVDREPVPRAVTHLSGEVCSGRRRGLPPKSIFFIA